MRSKIKKFIPFFIGKKLRGLWQRTQTVYYFGYKYKCPFCKNSFRKLLAGGFDLPVIYEKEIIGAGRRKNCVCPRCYSTDRDRLILLYLQNYSNIFTDKLDVIHVAPSGSLKAFLSKLDNINYQAGVKYHEGFYYSKDISIIDITDLKFEDKSFDVIFCNHVLEHIIDDHKAMSELYRILRPGGWAILQVPISRVLTETYEDSSITDPKEREKHFGQFDHVRIYGQDYPKRLEKAGFRVKQFDPVEYMNLLEAEKYAINQKEILFVAYKD